MLDSQTIQTPHLYRQLAEQQRHKAARETLRNVRLLLERSAERWEALADAIATEPDTTNGVRHRTPPQDTPHHPSCSLRAGNLIFDFAKRIVAADGATVELSPNEFALVELLAAHSGSFVTKQMLLEHIYPGKQRADPKIIDVYVCKLRKKLSRVCGGDDLIQTRYGHGYLLEQRTANAA